ncbi:MAG: aspartate kinase [Chitinophagaceae bacterium]
MKVFKFGGASVNSVERIKNVAEILKQYSTDNLVIIISAMGKTTNALEKVAESFFDGNNAKALELYNDVKQQHLTTAKELLTKNFDLCSQDLSNFFTEAEWLLHDKPVRSYDYYYDQVVSIGELLSTCIVSHFLNEIGLKNTWLDVRDIIRTDNNFRDAIVDWEITEEKVNSIKLYNFNKQNIVITQGFIGATDDNESTTLGREGSDYTAAIFANLTNAESLTIWKDVEGVMNADPKQFAEAQLINELSFEEVIEMAFYGAQVIHPKTIKPLQNKKIPLLVKCFLDASLAGTIIHDKNVKNLPPIIVIKENQVLITLQSQDFSFVGEKPMSMLYSLFEEFKIKPNLIQTGAISVQICLDDKKEKLEALSAKAASIFNVQVQKQLTLISIRHYNKVIIEKVIGNRKIILEQKTENTFQALCF